MELLTVEHKDFTMIGPLFKYRRTNREMRDIYIEIEAVIQEKL